MNRMVAEHLKRITQSIDDLREEILETRRTVGNLTDARDELQKKSWTQAKELSVYKQQATEFPRLKRENEHLNEQNRDFEQRLRRILQYTRALSVEFRS